MEHPERTILNCLTALRNRVYRQALIHTVTRAVFWGACVLAVLFIGIRLISFPIPMPVVTPLVIAGAVIVGICFSFRDWQTLFDTARFVEGELALKERVSTALELIEKNRQDAFTQLQILDTANTVATLEKSKIIPYTLPPLLKWMAIPLLLIAISFAVPRLYEVPQPLTDREKRAIDLAIENLERVDTSIIREKRDETINALKNVADAVDAQARLRTLTREVREQKSKLPDEMTIMEATQATQHFKGMDADALADELEVLAEQTEIPSELREALAELAAKLAADVPEGALSRSLAEIQGKVVSPDVLRDIADALREVKQLQQLEAQLAESRKGIALASIETEQLGDSIATSDGTPGQELGNRETQGTLATGGGTDFTPAGGDFTPAPDDGSPSKPLTGDGTPLASSPDGEVLTVTPAGTSDSERVTRSSAGDTMDTMDTTAASDYLPFSEVALAAQREYAQAVENKRIPKRYQAQIKTYLEAIATIDAKQGD